MSAVLRPVLCLLLLSSAMAVQAADPVFMFRVTQAGNLDLDAGRLADVLASPELQVVISYEPVLAIPGWTGRFGYCSPRRICLKGKWRTLVLSGGEIKRDSDTLSFAMPRHHWFGGMRYRLAGPVRISLPAFWPYELPGNIDLDLTGQVAGKWGVRDMHLAAPYVGVAAFGLVDMEARRGHAVPSCDPTVEVAADGAPAIRPVRQAEAYVDWLGRLAESDWWASQVDDVTYVQQALEPEALQRLGAKSGDWREVRVRRQGMSLRHVAVRVQAAGQCAGSRQYEADWINGELLSAAVRERGDIFADAACPADDRSREAIWWQGRLERYVGDTAGRPGIAQWDRWRTQHSGCAAAVEQGEPEAEADWLHSQAGVLESLRP